MEQNRRQSAAASRSEAVLAVDARGERTTEDSSFALLRDNIFEAMRILVLRRWAFFIPFCVVTCIATIASHWIPRSYESTTVVERRDHPVLINLRQTAATGGFARLFRPTLQRDIKSVENMTDVVAKLGLVENLSYDDDGKLTEESYKRCQSKGKALAAGIVVKLNSKDDHLDQIQVTYAGGDPVLPQRIVDQVKETYILRTREKLADVLTEVKSYFEKVVEEQRGEIDALEEEILRFQAEHLGVDPTDPSALKLKITSFESETSELEREIGSLQNEIEMRRKLLQSYQVQRPKSQQVNVGTSLAAPKIIKSVEAQAIEDEIRSLQKEVRDLRLVRRMTDRHPDVVERTNRIAALRDKLKIQYIADAKTLPANHGLSINDQVAATVVEEAVGFDMELASLQMDIQEREGRMALAQSRRRVVEENIRKLEALSANVFQFRKQYALQSDLLDQVRAQHRINTRRVSEIASILDADASDRGMSFTEIVPPTASIRPVRPQGKTVLALALLAGLGAGAVSVLLKELFDQTYHTTKQITRSLGLAILESVDEIVTSVDRARLFRRRVIYAPAVVTMLAGAVGLFCATAYLSLEQPGTYNRFMRIPRGFMNSMAPHLMESNDSVFDEDVDSRSIVDELVEGRSVDHQPADNADKISPAPEEPAAKTASLALSNTRSDT